MLPMCSIRRRLATACTVAALGAACTDPARTPSGPETPRVMSIRVSADSVRLDALGATAHLAATAHDQHGRPIMPAGLVWGSMDTTVVRVDDGGTVTAVKRGTAGVFASVGSVHSPPAAVTVAPVPVAVVKVAGDLQTAAVGEPLPEPIVVELRDRLGSPVADQTVYFYTLTGNVSPTVDSTDGDGRAQAVWTLGDLAIVNNTLRVSTVGDWAMTSFIAISVPGPPTAVRAVSSPMQQGIIDQALAAPVVVRVHDRYGNGVTGVVVDFVITAGGGTATPAAAVTAAEGKALTVWSLGSSLGTQTLEARVTGLAGSPVVFGVLATDLQILSTMPDTLVQGQTATIHGRGFDAVPDGNTVVLGSDTLVVSAASPTTLTITVPSHRCRPALDAALTVTKGGVTSGSLLRRVDPASFVSLATGEQLILGEPAQFCLQFRGTGTAAAYLIGVSSAAERPATELILGVDGVVGAGPPSSEIGLRVSPGAGTPPPRAASPRERHPAAERPLREWERRHLPVLRSAMARAPRGEAMVARAPIPNVGDLVSVKVPTDFGDPCDAFKTIGAKVRVVGAAGIWVTDTLNPVWDSLTTAEIQAYSDTFDTKIYPVDTLYFGSPTDLDGNGRVIVVLTVEVNRIPGGIAGFVFGGDLFPAAECSQSNEGELFYSHVPDVIGESGNGQRPKAGVLFQMPSLIAHEFAHNIQLSQRLIVGAGIPLTSWEAEGQASLAEELVGHHLLGNPQGQNYGASVVRAPAPGSPWYEANFLQLALYFGWYGGSTRAFGAPDRCSVYGPTGLSPCVPFAFYGASWALQRYLADRFGPSYPGGVPGLNRDLIARNVLAQGVANIEGLGLGVAFDSVFAQWAAMLFVDGRIGNAAEPLTLSTWDLRSVFNSFPAALQLEPLPLSFAPVSHGRAVVGGSTAYMLLSAAVSHPAYALRISGDPATAALLRPRLWVVRLQ